MGNELICVGLTTLDVVARPVEALPEDGLALIEEGLTNREIAARLMRSRRTVATHVEHILAKLGVGSRAAIASESVRHRRSREV